ncbi:lysophospholipid acyltransferase family protein [Limnohabitans radicicola]
MPVTNNRVPSEEVLPVAHVLIALMRFFAVLPLPWVRALGQGFGWLLWHAARSRRHIVLVNLGLCFPELSEAERRALAYRHFVAFGQSVLDRSWLWHAPLDVVRQRLQWTGEVDALTASGPLVMFAPHFVGLDAGGTAVSLKMPVPVAFIFSAQSNRVVEKWVRAGRERGGNARPHFRHEGMRQILAGLKRGEPLHLSPDMDFGRNESIFVPFMKVGQAATVTSLSRLSRVANARVVPVVTRMTPEGYSIEAHAPISDFPSRDLTQDTARMNQLLEGYIRTMPEQYHWVHRRFKTRPEGQPGVY